MMPNERDLRKALAWVKDQMPKDGDQVSVLAARDYQAQEIIKDCLEAVLLIHEKSRVEKTA